MVGIGVLLSGGIDSMALLHRLMVESDEALSAYYFDYGQPAHQFEREAARAVVAEFDIPLVELRLKPEPVDTDGEFLHRNARLILALASHEPALHAIAIGVTAGTPYVDCTPEHMALVYELLNDRPGDDVRLLTPLIAMTKGETIQYCQTNDLPITLTYSCELGTSPPCGDCATCRDLEAIAST